MSEIKAMTADRSRLLLEHIEKLKKAVMLAVIAMDCERNGLTPDGNVRERLVKALHESDQLVAALAVLPPQEAPKDK